MKCFIDSVVQEATFYFIIIVMMPEGFLRQKKKKMWSDFPLHHHDPESFCVRCFIEWQLSFMGAWIGHGSQGTVREPSWIALGSAAAGRETHATEDLGWEVHIGFLRVCARPAGSGRKQGREDALGLG